jgi:antitoxin component YwqK of YwqJK toxin-antitoxin module
MSDLAPIRRKILKKTFKSCAAKRICSIKTDLDYSHSKFHRFKYHYRIKLQKRLYNSSLIKQTRLFQRNWGLDLALKRYHQDLLKILPLTALRWARRDILDKNSQRNLVRVLNKTPNGTFVYFLIRIDERQLYGTQFLLDESINCQHRTELKEGIFQDSENFLDSCSYLHAQGSSEFQVFTMKNLARVHEGYFTAKQSALVTQFVNLENTQSQAVRCASQITLFRETFLKSDVPVLTKYRLGTSWNSKTGSLEYQGSFKEDKPHGFGVLYHECATQSQIKYIGNFHIGFYHKKGIQYLQNGQKWYEGEHDYGKYHNYGKLWHAGTGVLQYQGFFKKGQKAKRGTSYWWNSMVKYRGEFDANMEHGIGVAYHDDGNRKYNGNWYQGSYHGMGFVFDANGDKKYHGNLDKGIKSGFGTQFYDNGEIFYQGEFAYDKMDGIGKSYYEDGTLKYSGGLKNGERDGFGTAYNSEGVKIYDGHYAGGLKNGNGVNYDSQGAHKVYSGDFHNGKQIGWGTTYDENENKVYEGELWNGLREGQGTLYTFREGIYKGTFQDNLP